MENRFVKAKSLSEALSLVNSFDSKIIAGGTDLIIEMRKNKAIYKNIVDISDIEELKKIRVSEDVISIGACCIHSDIEKNEIIKKYIPIISKGCSLVGSTLVRNRGTIGGNIVNNSNCADSVPPLLLLDARLIIENLHERKTVALKDFFKDREKLDLKKNEIVTSIEVKPLCGYKYDIVKVGRRKSLAVSRLTLAAAVKIENGIFRDLRLCCGAVLPRHQRLTKVEIEFRGAKVTDDTLQSIGDMASFQVLAITGERWSSEYKIPVLREMIIRTLSDLSLTKEVNKC